MSNPAADAAPLPELAWCKHGEFTLTSSQKAVSYLVQTYQPCATPPAGGFPVLYCLDGNALFGSACDLSALVANPRKLHPDMRPVLIVAVGYPEQSAFHERQRARDFTPPPTAAQSAASALEFGHAADFLHFLEHDLRPQVQQRFVVDAQQQCLFGHSLGGLFVMRAYLEHPRSFSKYIAASPSVWYNDFELVALLRDWRSETEARGATVAPLLVTFGALENSGPSSRPPADTQRLRQEFVRTLAEMRTAQPVWVYSHPAEHHITNLFASLPKAVVLAACQSSAACHALLDDRAA